MVKRLPVDPLLLLHPLLQCAKRVRHRGNSRAVHAEVVVHGATARHIQTFFDRTMTDQVQHQLRLVVLLVPQGERDTLGSYLYSPGHMSLVQIPQQLCGVWALMAHHLIHGNLEHLSAVDFDAVIQAVLHAGQAHPVAAHRDPLPGKRFGIAQTHEASVQGLVTGKARPAVLVLEQVVHRFVQELSVDVFVHSYRDVASRIQLIRSLEHHIAELAEQGIAVFVCPSDLVIVRIVEQQTSDVEDRLVPGDPPLFHVGIVVLFEHFIELETRSVAVVGAAGHVEPANPLTGFPHGFGRTVEDVAIYLRHLKQVFPQDRMALHTGQTLALLNRVRDPVLHTMHHKFLRVVKLCVFGVLFAVESQLFQDPAPAKAQPDPVVAAEVRVRADPGDNAIQFLFRLEIIVGKIRVPVQPLVRGFLVKPDHTEHPAAGERVHRINVDRVLSHQLVKILAPPVIPVPGTVLMVRNAMELVRLRSRDASIVIPVLIHLHGGLHPGFLKLSFL